MPSGSLWLPKLNVAALDPARRLHKICKGRRVSARSTSAADYLPAAMEWVSAQQDAGCSLEASGGKRINGLLRSYRRRSASIWRPLGPCDQAEEEESALNSGKVLS